MKTKNTQEQFRTFERNGQLVLALNSEIMLPENAPVRRTSAQLEELDYRKLYEAYSPKGRKSVVDPKVMLLISSNCSALDFIKHLLSETGQKIAVNISADRCHENSI